MPRVPRRIILVKPSKVREQPVPALTPHVNPHTQLLKGFANSRKDIHAKLLPIVLADSYVIPTFAQTPSETCAKVQGTLVALPATNASRAAGRLLVEKATYHRPIVVNSMRLPLNRECARYALPQTPESPLRKEKSM